MSKGVAHALDYDFRLVPPEVMVPLQRRLETGLRQGGSSEVKSPSWRGNLQSSPRALEVWASGLLGWALRRRQRAGRLSTCTRR